MPHRLYPGGSRGQADRARSGFTLVELLVASAVFGMITIGMLAVTIVANRGWYSDVGMLGLQQQARQALDGMVRELRQSDDMPISICAARVDFTIPSVSGTVSYYLESNQIIREHPAGSKKVLANDIYSLDFCPDGHVLEITVEARKTILSRELAFVLTDRARLRND